MRNDVADQMGLAPRLGEDARCFLSAVSHLYLRTSQIVGKQEVVSR